MDITMCLLGTPVLACVLVVIMCVCVCVRLSTLCFVGDCIRVLILRTMAVAELTAWAGWPASSSGSQQSCPGTQRC